MFEKPLFLYQSAVCFFQYYYYIIVISLFLCHHCHITHVKEQIFVVSFLNPRVRIAVRMNLVAYSTILLTTQVFLRQRISAVFRCGYGYRFFFFLLCGHWRSEQRLLIALLLLPPQLECKSLINLPTPSTPSNAAGADTYTHISHGSVHGLAHLHALPPPAPAAQESSRRRRCEHARSRTNSSDGGRRGTREEEDGGHQDTLVQP